MRKLLCFAAALILFCVALLPLFSCEGKPLEQAEANNTTKPAQASAEPAGTLQPSDEPAVTAQPEPTDDPQPVFKPRQRPETVTVEWLAEELIYRYYIGWMNLELADFSNIMDRNRETDLFFYTNQYKIEAVRLGVVSGIASPGPGTAEVKWIVDETEAEITVHVYVEPNLVWIGGTSGGGTEFQITVDKQRMVIIGFDQDMCEGVYCTRLKPLAFEYRVNLPWEEADKKAYDELYEELVRSTEIH